MKNYYKLAFLLLWTGFIICFTPAAAQTLQSDSLALVDLYNDCGGTNWVGFDNWLNGPISTWEEVTIDPTLNRVSHVGFKNMDLTGSLPASLGNMDEMSGKIEFHDDKGLTGTFPAFIWNWTKIDRFQLKRSGITAIDTTGLSNLVNLTEFNTEANPITFTSGASNPQPGDWGGVIINGNAPLSRQSGANSNAATEVNNTIFFGGNDPADNSGIINYVQESYVQNVTNTKESNKK